MNISCKNINDELFMIRVEDRVKNSCSYVAEYCTKLNLASNIRDNDIIDELDAIILDSNAIFTEIIGGDPRDCENKPIDKNTVKKETFHLAQSMEKIQLAIDKKKKSCSFDFFAQDQVTIINDLAKQFLIKSFEIDGNMLLLLMSNNDRTSYFNVLPQDLKDILSNLYLHLPPQ